MRLKSRITIALIAAVLSSSLLTLSVMADDHNQNGKLHGNYFVVINRSSIIAPFTSPATSSFNTTSQTPLNPQSSFFQSIATSGIMVFDGRGGVTFQGHINIINHINADGGTGVPDAESGTTSNSEGTYTVASDGSVTIMLGNATTTFETGPPAAPPVPDTTVSQNLNAVAMTGFLSPDNKTLTVNYLTPEFELVTHVAGPQTGKTLNRYCNLTGVGTKVGD